MESGSESRVREGGGEIVVGVKWRWGFRVEVIVSSQAETETGTLLE